MKKRLFMRLRFLAAAVLLVLVLSLFTGCAMTEVVKGRGLFQEREQVTLGEVVQADGSVVEVPLTNKVFSVNTAVVEALRGVKEVNSLANPTPAAPFVNLGITAALGILGAIASWKTRAANKNLQMADLLIAGIETANNSDVKDAIKQLSVQKGLADVVRRRVNKVTGK